MLITPRVCPYMLHVIKNYIFSVLGQKVDLSKTDNQLGYTVRRRIAKNYMECFIIELSLSHCPTILLTSPRPFIGLQVGYLGGVSCSISSFERLFFSWTLCLLTSELDNVGFLQLLCNKSPTSVDQLSSLTEGQSFLVPHVICYKNKLFIRNGGLLRRLYSSQIRRFMSRVWIILRQLRSSLFQKAQM